MIQEAKSETYTRKNEVVFIKIGMEKDEIKRIAQKLAKRED